MDYKVGQVLYALSSKQMSVMPVQITERIVRQTLEGEETSYVAKTANGKVISDLKKVKATFYKDPDEVTEALMTNVSNVVQEIVSSAKAAASETFGVQHHQQTTEPADESVKSGNDDKKVVTLSDGTVANIKLPEALGG